jgi:hypothetical protein
MTKEYHILPAGSCWETEEKISKRKILRSPTKRDLIFRTMEVAKKNSKSKIVIHNNDGSVEEVKVWENNQDTKLKDFLKLYYQNL